MRLLRFLVGLAAAVLLLGVVLGFGAPVLFELDLLASFRLHFLGLSAALLVLALLLRARVALWTSLAAMVLAVAGLGPLWTDPWPGRSTGSTPVAGITAVTVMTANLYGLNETPEAMREALLAADADILVTHETKRDAVGGPPGEFHEPASLTLRYPYHAIANPAAAYWRTVIWSKFPIREARPLTLDTELSAYGVGAVIELGEGRELSVVGLHVSHILRGDQKAQIDQVRGMVERLPRPLVVMGDFNATAWSWAMRHAQALTGTRRLGGVIRTWAGAYPTPLGPVPEPFGLPIDHILVSKGIGFSEIGTMEIPGSDHDALRAVLHVPK